MKIELRPHQKDAVSRMHNGCVLWGGVGTGKTITALAYAMEREEGRKVVVITTARKRDSLDWIKEAALMGFPSQDIQVESWNKIKDFVDLEGYLFIFDEQRLVGSGAWTKSFQKIVKKNRWVLLSATPGDTWGDYGPLFIANGWYKNVTEFRQNHAVYSRYTTYPKIEKWINQGRLRKYRDHILVEMPMERHTTRHINYVECDYDKELLEIVRKRRWNVYEDKPIENAAELFSVMRKVVSTDPSRLESLHTLLKKHPKIIVFYNFDYELEMLRTLGQSRTSSNENPLPWSQCSPTCPRCLNNEFERSSEKSINESSSSTTDEPSTRSFAIAEWNGHKHEPIPKTDRWVYLVQYAAGAEAWNCVETDAMVFWSLTYSYKHFQQAQGRIDRMNTPFSDLNYYVMMTNSPADRPVLAALKQKKDFQPRG